MGFRTYHQIVTELSPNTWVYDNLTSYVLTHRTLPSSESIIFTEKSPGVLLPQLKTQPGKDIWICGGSKIVSQCVIADCIDEYYLSIIPTILSFRVPALSKRAADAALKAAGNEIPKRNHGSQICAQVTQPCFCTGIPRRLAYPVQLIVRAPSPVTLHAVPKLSCNAKIVSISAVPVSSKPNTPVISPSDAMTVPPARRAHRWQKHQAEDKTAAYPAELAFSRKESVRLS